MPVDPALLGILETSLARLEPGSSEANQLSIHLATQHLASGHAARALELTEAVLLSEPRNVEALSIGAAAAGSAGQQSRAEELRNRQLGLIANDHPSDAEPDGLGVALESAEYPSDSRSLRLDDVIGMDDVKRRLRRSFLGPIANPALADAFSADVRGGLLLWGPPGVGKTYIGRALAGELNAGFLSASPADIYSSYFGASENNLARLFKEARERTPCVIFLDEIDAVGGRRAARHADQSRSTVNQLLTELDGLADNQGVFVLAATNAPWEVDAALRRPGRLDRTVLVLPPDAPARLALLEQELASRPTADDLDIRKITARTEVYTGADLKRLVAAAGEAALERSLDAGAVIPVTNGDLEAALADTPASARPWFAQAANYVAYASDGQDYSEFKNYLRAHRLP